MLADARHELGGQSVRLEHLERERIGGSDALRVRLVQQVEGALARVGAFVGARDGGHRPDDQTRVM